MTSTAAALPFHADSKVIPRSVGGIKVSEYITRRIRIGGTKYIDHKVYEVATSGSHSETTRIDGKLYGEVGSRKVEAGVPPEFASDCRLANAKEARQVLLTAYPYLTGEQRGPSDSTIAVVAGKAGLASRLQEAV